MIVSQSSAQPTASCSSGTVTGKKRIVTSKGLRCRRGPVKISAGSEAPPHERKIQLKENIACYWLLFGRDSEYWPVIGLITPIKLTIPGIPAVLSAITGFQQLRFAERKAIPDPADEVAWPTGGAKRAARPERSCATCSAAIGVSSESAAVLGFNERPV